MKIAHKPFPSGRLTHGVVDGLGRLMQDHGFCAGDIAHIRADVPPLVHRLVGRPLIPNPEPNYAKLCLPFVAGTFLEKGNVDVPDFRGTETLSDPKVHDYARMVEVVLDDNPDQNALTPQLITVTLKSGQQHRVNLPEVYGHPDVPLSDQENIDKFRRCAKYATPPMDSDAAEALITAVENLSTLDDVAFLMSLSRNAPKEGSLK